MLCVKKELILAVLVLKISCSGAGPSYPYGHVMRVNRRFSRRAPLDRDESSIPIFDATYPRKECRGLASKYQEASRFLRGIGLAPESNITRYYSTEEPVLTDLNAESIPSERSPEPSRDSIIPPIDVPSTATATMPLTGLMYGTIDILYYGDIDFGTPHQRLSVDIDTGSADLWIPVNCGLCSNKQLDSGMSSTYADSHEKFEVHYGAGEVSGTIATDVVSLSGLSVSNQAFGAITDLSEEFNSYPNSGLLGLAFGTIARSKQPTFLERLILEKKLAAPLFSVHLARNEASGSEICVGCFDASKARGSITWVPVKSKTYWSVSMDGLAINDNLKISTNLIAAIDTGTTLIYLPDDITAQMYSAIPGARPAPPYGPEFYTYPCSSPLTIAFSFGERRFELNMADFNLGRSTPDSTECVGGILSLGNGFPSDLAIIGDEFLKSWYTTFDYGNGARIGFSPSINNA